MPERRWKMRVGDLLTAIDRIDQYTKGMDFDEFRQDQRTIDAVIRNLEIIGEAANHIPDEVQANIPEVPWDKMRGIRNVVAHGYFGVSLPIIWQTVRLDLSPMVYPLRKAIDNLSN